MSSQQQMSKIHYLIHGLSEKTILITEDKAKTNLSQRILITPVK